MSGDSTVRNGKYQITYSDVAEPSSKMSRATDKMNDVDSRRNNADSTKLGDRNTL